MNELEFPFGLQDFFHSQFFAFLWIQPHSGLKVFDSKQICFFPLPIKRLGHGYDPVWILLPHQFDLKFDQTCCDNQKKFEPLGTVH